MQASFGTATHSLSCGGVGDQHMEVKASPDTTSGFTISSSMHFWAVEQTVLVNRWWQALVGLSIRLVGSFVFLIKRYSSSALRFKVWFQERSENHQRSQLKDIDDPQKRELSRLSSRQWRCSVAARSTFCRHLNWCTATNSFGAEDPQSERDTSTTSASTREF